VGHEGRGVYRVLVEEGGRSKARDHWEDLGVGGRITFRRTLGRQGSMWRTGPPKSLYPTTTLHGVTSQKTWT